MDSFVVGSWMKSSEPTMRAWSFILVPTAAWGFKKLMLLTSGLSAKGGSALVVREIADPCIFIV